MEWINIYVHLQRVLASCRPTKTLVGLVSISILYVWFFCQTKVHIRWVKFIDQFQNIVKYGITQLKCLVFTLPAGWMVGGFVERWSRRLNIHQYWGGWWWKRKTQTRNFQVFHLIWFPIHHLRASVEFNVRILFTLLF